MQLYDETKRLFAAKLGVDPDNLPLTLTVPRAGKAAYGLSAPRAYAAAKDGTLETVTVARKKHVPTLKLIKKLADEVTAYPISHLL